MVRVTLIVALVVTLVGLAWVTVEWARLNYVPTPRPIEVPVDAFIQHPGFEAMAIRAIESFAAMPEARRRVLSENLRANLGTLDRELAELRASRLTILCIGERHMAATRRFLADVVLTTLPFDVLLLETSSDELPEIMRRIDTGESWVPLLGEDIAAVVRSARGTNPNIVVAGIDETQSQKNQRIYRKQGSRDLSIAGNLRSHVRRGKRHAVIFGALHCADQPNWMYRRIRLGEHRVSREEIRNVNVIGEHQNGTVEAFLEFIHVIGVARRNFMIADTSALDSTLFTWFPALTRSFARFHSVIVFREHDHAHSRARPRSLE
jgi:hypothetical protein